MSTSPKKDLTANPKAPRRTEDRSPEDKLRLVVEAAKLSESELGAFLRREGVHDRWSASRPGRDLDGDA
jgi:hypothetical protein